MKKNSLARVAAFAAAALVGGLVPTLGVASASAAEPTGVTVSPSTATVASGGQAAFTVTLTGPNLTTPANTVRFNVSSTSLDPSTGLAGTACAGITGTAPTFTAVCTVRNTHNGPGVDNITFFYDADGNTTFSNGDPSTTGTMKVVGLVDHVALAPSVGHASVNGFQKYIVSAFDSANTPVPNATLQVKSSVPAQSAAKVAVENTDPGTAVFGGTPNPVGTVTTDATGTHPEWVTSDTVGTVGLTVNPINGTAVDTNISATGTLVVSAGGAEAVKTVAVTPSPQNAFTATTVSETITLTNASGDVVSGVTPSVAVLSGPNTGATISGLSATNGLGQVTVTYQANATVGTDSVRAFVQQTTGGTAGIDPSEPRGFGVVNLATNIVTGITGPATPVSAPTDVTTVPLTFIVATSTGASKAGINVAFALAANTPAKYSITATGVTDVSGKVTATVTNAAPVANDSVSVTASVAGFTSSPATTINWKLRQASDATVVISPVNQTGVKGGMATFNVTATQFGAPATGLTYTWKITAGRNVANFNATVVTTSPTFTYTDAGTALDTTTPANNQDTITVQATAPGGTPSNTATAHQFWVAGTGLAAQSNIDLGANGAYDATTPFAASGFVKSKDVAVTVAKTSVVVRLIDANGGPLFNKTVSFTSTGVGGFVQPDGTIVRTISAATTAVNGKSVATVDVGSSATGVQTITATVDGISDTATVTYTGQYTPITPVRGLDSRIGLGTFTSNNGNAVVGGRLAANTVYNVTLSPALKPLTTYALNVTAIKASGLGNLRVVPGDASGIPETSLVNYQAGKDVANLIIVKTDANGSLNLYSDSSTVAVAIDVVGFYAADGITEVAPSRVANITPVAGGTSHSFQIGGNGGIPMGATAVALNVTAVSPSNLGNLRVYPDGAGVPLASNINYIVRQDKSAFVVIKLPSNGKIDVFSDGGSAGVAIDAFAYFTDTNNLVTSAPLRITAAGTSLAANVARSIPVVGINGDGVPADAQAVLVSVTSIHTASSTGVGNLRVYPTAGAVPVVSTLNYVSKTSDVANFAIVKLGTNGEITLFSDGSPINVAVDVLGYVPAGK